MFDNNNYKIADLSNETKEKLADFEKNIREITGSKIVLVAYEVN